MLREVTTISLVHASVVCSFDYHSYQLDCIPSCQLPHICYVPDCHPWRRVEEPRHRSYLPFSSPAETFRLLIHNRTAKLRSCCWYFSLLPPPPPLLPLLLCNSCLHLVPPQNLDPWQSCKSYIPVAGDFFFSSSFWFFSYATAAFLFSLHRTASLRENWKATFQLLVFSSSASSFLPPENFYRT